MQVWCYNWCCNVYIHIYIYIYIQGVMGRFEADVYWCLVHEALYSPLYDSSIMNLPILRSAKHV